MFFFYNSLFLIFLFRCNGVFLSVSMEQFMPWICHFLPVLHCFVSFYYFRSNQIMVQNFKNVFDKTFQRTSSTSAILPRKLFPIELSAILSLWVGNKKGYIMTLICISLSLRYITYIAISIHFTWVSNSLRKRSPLQRLHLYFRGCACQFFIRHKQCLG